MLGSCSVGYVLLRVTSAFEQAASQAVPPRVTHVISPQTSQPVPPHVTPIVTRKSTVEKNVSDGRNIALFRPRNVREYSEATCHIDDFQSSGLTHILTLERGIMTP